MSETSKTSTDRSSIPTVAWITVQRKDGDPLRPEVATYNLQTNNPDDVWAEVERMEKAGWAVLAVEGESGR